MNKKYYFLTALFIIISPLLIQWITIPLHIRGILPEQWGANIPLFSVLLIPLALGFTSYLWKLPTRPIRIIYLVVLSVSALFNIIPLLIVPPFPLNEMGGTIILNIMIQFVLPVALFMGAYWLGTIWHKSRSASHLAGNTSI